MKTQFVKTSNVNRFLTGVAALQDRGAAEACFAVMQGQAGFGKTATAKWWAFQNEAVFLRIQESMSPTWLLRDLVTELGDQVPANRVEKLFQQACTSLVPNPRPIVVDEAERAIKNIAILENLRDLSDLIEMPVILVGREYTLGKLERHPQIRTRVSSEVNFQAATLEDVAELAKELCEVELHEGVIDRIHKESEGYTREVMKALKNVERMSKRNSGKTVTLEMIKDKQLCRERVASRSKRAA